MSPPVGISWCYELLRTHLTNTIIYDLVVMHSRHVADFARTIALRRPEWHVEPGFVYEAALLHDIGLCGVELFDPYTDHSTGNAPYMMHQKIGHDILVDAGYPDHAAIALTHGGLGFGIEQITRDNVDLPHYDCIPTSRAEKIVAFADCFFAKNTTRPILTIPQIRAKFAHYNDSGKIPLFLHYCDIMLDDDMYPVVSHT